MSNVEQLNFSQNDISYETIFLNSFVISFNDKKLDLMKKVFNKAGIQTMPKKYEAFHDKAVSGQYNCSLSHAGIVKMAKAINLPFVCIFEDDAYPCRNFIEKLKKYILQIPQNANILMLGYCGNRDKKPIQNNNIVKTPSYTYGSHAYIIFAKGYNEYLKLYAKTAHDKNVNADGMLWRMSNSYCIGDPLFIQYSNSSSMNNHYGYIYFKNRKTPPLNFDAIQKYDFLDYDKIFLNIKNKYLSKYSKILELSKKYSNCSIIGTNEKEINVFKKDDTCIIKCANNIQNIFPVDLYISYESMKNKFKHIQNIIFIKHSDILDISNFMNSDKNKWFSTVFVFILLALCAFKTVEINNIQFTSGKNHDSKYEMLLLNHLVKTIYNKKLIINNL